MAFSVPQQVALALAPKITGFISVLGSFWILVEVAMDKLKRKNVYHRLLFGLSAVDLVSSLAFFFSTWPIPLGSNTGEGGEMDVVWAVGNRHTCRFQGFWIQFGIASPVYNALLALYHQLIVQYGFTERTIRYNGWEFGMHVMAASIAVFPACCGLYLDLYHNANVWCWIAPVDNDEHDEMYCEEHYDDDSDDVVCLENEQHNNYAYRFTFYYGILWICLAFSLCSLVSVYWVIKQREEECDESTEKRKSKRVSKQNSDSNMATIEESPSNVTNTSSKSNASFLVQKPVLGDRTSSFIVVKAASADDALDVDSGKISNDGVKNSDGTRSSAKTQELKEYHHHSDSNISQLAQKQQNEQERAQLDAVYKAISKIKSSNHLSRTATSLASRLVYGQLLMYTGAFFITYSFATINRIVQAAAGRAFFPLMFLHVLFIPLQGAFNFMIYRRSAYYRLRQQHPHLTRWQTFMRTWRWTFLGPPKVAAEMDTIHGRHWDPTELPAPPTPSGKSKPLITKNYPCRRSFHPEYSPQIDRPQIPDYDEQPTPLHRNSVTVPRLSDIGTTSYRQFTDDDVPFDEKPDPKPKLLQGRNESLSLSNLVEDDAAATAAAIASAELKNVASDDVYDNDEEIVNTFLNDMMASYTDFPNLLTEDSMMLSSGNLSKNATNFPVSRLSTYPTITLPLDQPSNEKGGGGYGESSPDGSAPPALDLSLPPIFAFSNSYFFSTNYYQSRGDGEDDRSNSLRSNSLRSNMSRSQNTGFNRSQNSMLQRSQKSFFQRSQKTTNISSSSLLSDNNNSKATSSSHRSSPPLPPSTVSVNRNNSNLSQHSNSISINHTNSNLSGSLGTVEHRTVSDDEGSLSTPVQNENNDSIVNKNSKSQDDLSQSHASNANNNTNNDNDNANIVANQSQGSNISNSNRSITNTSQGRVSGSIHSSNKKNLHTGGSDLSVNQSLSNISNHSRGNVSTTSNGVINRSVSHSSSNNNNHMQQTNSNGSRNSNDVVTSRSHESNAGGSVGMQMSNASLSQSLRSQDHSERSNNMVDPSQSNVSNVSNASATSNRSIGSNR